MKIKQAEELVGITSKNIRFYEVRKFGTPLEEIHQLFQGKMSMQECLENRG